MSTNAQLHFDWMAIKSIKPNLPDSEEKSIEVAKMTFIKNTSDAVNNLKVM